MKLQINNSGAWKTVTNFRLLDLATAKRHAECLGQMDHETGCRSTWRVLDDAGQVDWHWEFCRGWKAWAKPGSRSGHRPEHEAATAKLRAAGGPK